MSEKVKTIEIEPRSPSGRKRTPKAHPRSLYRRLRDNRETMVRMGGHPDWGSPLGLYRMNRVFTEQQYEAGKIYANVAGRYRRYFADEDLPMTCPSPGFQRGSRGNDDELERRSKVKDGIADYEDAARRVKKRWLKIRRCIVTARANQIIKEICLYEHEVPEADQVYIAPVLTAIAMQFGLGDFR